MDVKTFRHWLDAMIRAWESRDPLAARALFSDDATYQETPFDEPMRGIEAIFRYWSEVPKVQDEVKCECEVLAVAEGLGVARWRTTFVRIPSRVRVELDGILTVRLDDRGRCREFLEWWHRREQPSPGAPAAAGGGDRP
jgi:hypothetical protein